MTAYTRAEAKEYALEKIRGIYLAFCLPETPDGEIDEKGLRHDVRYYVDTLDAGGLYVHGFYGNFWLLTSAERRHVMEIVADEVGGRIPIICRCAHQSMRETIELIKHAEACGADFISLIGPAFGSASDAMVIEYFEHVAASTNLGISIFNTPQAGYVISPPLMARLAQIPNVCALKNDISMSHTIEVRHLVGTRIVVVDPSEENFLVNMAQFGQKAIYTGTGYMFDTATAHPMHDYVAAALSGDFPLAAERYYAMQPLRDLHRRWVLEPWVRDDLCPISTIKAWTELLGLTGGRARSPLPDLPATDRLRLAQDLRTVGLVTGDRG